MDHYVTNDFAFGLLDMGWADRTTHELHAKLEAPRSLSMIVIRADAPANKQLGELVDEQVLNEAKQLWAYRVLDRRDAMAGGAPAIETSAQWFSDGVDLYMRAAHVSRDGGRLTLVTSAELELQSLCDESLARAVTTFRFADRAAPPPASSYVMNDGSFELADLGFYDRTVHSLEASGRDAEIALTIDHTPLPRGVSVRDYASIRSRRDKEELGRLTQLRAAELQCAFVPVFETSARYIDEGGARFQRRAFFRLSDWVFSITLRGRADEVDATLGQILATLGPRS